MKRTLLLISLIFCVFLFASCSSTHEHTYSSDWSCNSEEHWRSCAGCGEKAAVAMHDFGEHQGNAETARSCTVCGYVDPAHIYSDAWISDSAHHWRECTDADCTATSGMNMHVFGDPVTTLEPTSERDGISMRVCEICGRGVSESIAKLPSKMTRDEWNAAFAFSNVRIESTSNLGIFGAISATHLIDGDFAEQISDGERNYTASADVIHNVDFSEYYDEFVHMGDGIYIADAVLFSTEGTSYTYTDCKITFDGDKILSISYGVNLGALFGNMSEEFMFYDWGEVSVTPPRITNGELIAIMSADAFFCNFTLTKEVYSKNGSYTMTVVRLFDDIYTYEITEGLIEETVTSSGYGSREGIAEQLSAELLGIVEHVNAESLIYESYVGFTLTEPISDLGSSGKTLDSFSVLVEDGRVATVSYSFAEDGHVITYCFENYVDLSEVIT